MTPPLLFSPTCSSARSWSRFPIRRFAIGAFIGRLRDRIVHRFGANAAADSEEKSSRRKTTYHASRAPLAGPLRIRRDRLVGQCPAEQRNELAFAMLGCCLAFPARMLPTLKQSASSCRFRPATVLLLQHLNNFERKPYCRANRLICYPINSAH